MSSSPVIAVLCGGTSSEKEVSLGSGRASALALSASFPTRLFELAENALPSGLDPARHVVFSTLHGTFGEDGGMQALLDAAGVAYAGCDAAASALCFNKAETKRHCSASGVRVCEGLVFASTQLPSVEEVLSLLGDQLVLKPNCNGSSVGLRLIDGIDSLRLAFDALAPGEWLLEKRVRGRELTVGVLNGQAMGVVEVVPKSGLFDYSSKYTKGMTNYHAPADIPSECAAQARDFAQRAFAACSCRDYARIDFMLSSDGTLFLLEINTLPGMKDTSLLPMSARCVGLDYHALVRELVNPACKRFLASRP